jgi:kumamolisin
MGRILRRFAIPAAIAVALVTAAHGARLTAGTSQRPGTQQVDLGPAAATQLLSASLVLRVRHPEALEALVAQTQDPDSAAYHRFLSVDEFVSRFAPSSNEIATITQYVGQFGITVTDTYADHLLLKATGSADAFNQAFALDVHNFADGPKHFLRPRHSPRIPAVLQDLLVAVVGPSTEARYRPMQVRSAQLPLANKVSGIASHGTGATGAPGDFTVGDVANFYNINPLYAAHIDGTGHTLGIATLADFVPADAFTYWHLLGLTVDPHRLTQVHVDGGGDLSADAGSGETSLDVEQSGGIAPGAKIIVYDAPNTEAGFIDLFYRAASDNLVESLSVSWGSAEVLYAEAVVGVDRTGQLLAFHQAFLESAAQGMSLFASSGDNGAYDINQAFNDPVNNVLSVDEPAADPAITAAGGTTLPFTANFGPGTPNLVVPSEQVFGWDYLQNYLVQFIDPSFQDALFPVGSGGGVSVFWHRPSYQAGTDGIRKSEPGQSIVFQNQDLLDLPAGFVGRNVPDVSLDADPFTGFFIISSKDGGFVDGFGGTSFVAPQLNGVSALLSQVTGGRLGLWNPMLYRFKKIRGAASPLVDITAGDNWFYNGAPGYEPGAGLGVLNVAQLAAAVANESNPEQHGHRNNQD